MKFLAAALIVALFAPSPALRGPHPSPEPGAVLAEFPETVSGWHGLGEGEHGKLHKASHLVVKGPDGMWVDGSVKVGEKVFFHPDRRAELAEGEYKATAWGRWSSGIEEEPFTWKFTVRRSK